MLILTLKRDECVLIGNDIKVMNVSPGRVRLGFQVPPGVQVDRSVVRQAKQAGLAGLTPGPDDRRVRT